MAKLARDLTYNRTENGHTDDKVGDLLNEKMDEFDKGFPNGVFADSGNQIMPKINMRALSRYCTERGIMPNEITAKEMEQFYLK